MACARRNGVAAVRGDLAAPLRGGSFDVVTAVAPYVPTGALRLLPADVQRHEPVRALDGGPDGLGVVARVIDDAARLLHPGGQPAARGRRRSGGCGEGAAGRGPLRGGRARGTTSVGDLRGVHALAGA